MSAFLGKIHYWLYNKIQLHEALIEDIAKLADNNGYKADSLISESYSKYGEPIVGSLEDNINHSNIHGWLQERIISVESRLAYIITNLLGDNIVKKEDIAHIFYQNGVNTMKELNVEDGTPENFFNLIFDYMLEGMPCDRVNEIIENSEESISWRTTSDLHRTYWDNVHGDVKNFNDFRDSWINGFFSESPAGYKYSRKEDGISTIEKV
ncbi:hypothetical protein BJV85_003250 [Clostridium acetobutylicum]|uniref:Uncharacterized protein n=1 Tax=Clostridium acetobutylicum (strain ATCC 824 / DSM 792 / JCM 1419 / IAM 19013 / LMG 5710 / NBRC 13948 / NRRL B-527 / VKM B-1787 / 2291 / W) TaxID=272562 RepID=Q97L07_CLOAB|nr:MULTISPECIES: hypothetical protein [Clostridium]AAK78735.1 Hypothetical protein CA_C0759 [Clostridium acetobutylicum ATCC 824]ADZ19809.1 Conserved hypothetical protein [Clostridium acetobutylicum EA 2018]AEI31423.1 hypothetical protein SMB_G0775 [Clostridium acetobutylicum DSM 1731]AWV80453.1 hypothetical protein DK921_10190 [Clostridium acetobutylicum]MBC2392644.1 hypothetical protein [Clostridium acetobutylicum]